MLSMILNGKNYFATQLLGGMEVDKARLKEDILATGEFGKIEVEGYGRTSLVGSDANRRAREYFIERLKDAGLVVQVDSVGNISGRWIPESTDSMATPVAAGSHLDSVPVGGIFDGPLGVFAALEAVRMMQEASLTPTRPIDVVSFTEEEGARFAPLLGSSVAAGHRSVDEALKLTDNGDTLEEALGSIGFRGEGRLDAGKWDAWVELHIEQAKQLEGSGIPVGIVNTITGIAHCDVEIRGEANHAGTTRMTERIDALAAASEFVLDIERGANDLVTSDYEMAVGTVGKALNHPNGTNIIPGRVELGVDIRDTDSGPIEWLIDHASRSLERLERERGVETELERVVDIEPMQTSNRVRSSAIEAGEEAGIKTLELDSGAGHDTQNIATVADAGLLFAPSQGGISHSPKEWTDWDDCAHATHVLAGTLANLVGADQN